MISQIQTQFELHNIHPRTTKLVAGISGGVDSMVMLYNLKQMDCDVAAVHVNYKKRGQNSDDDAKLVESTCKQYGFDFRLFEYTIEDISSTNFQESARNYRREKFNEIADESNASYILLAHHLDDQIETILQKILKGAGLNAVTGMKTLENRYFRPMLSISRQEIERFALQHSIKWNDDVSNQDTSYARNWIRNAFSPKLDILFPGWTQNIIKHAKRLEAVNELLDRSSKENHFQADEFPITYLDRKSEELQLLLLHHWLNQSNIFVSEGTLQQIQRLNTAQSGTKVIIDSQFDLFRERNHLKLVKKLDLESDATARINKPDLENAPIELKKNNLQLEIHLKNIKKGDKSTTLTNVSGESFGDLKKTSPSPPDQASKPNDHSIPSHIKGNASRLYLDADSLTFPLRMQPWDHGDKFNPLGMDTSKLVSDVLTDRKMVSSQKKNAIKITDFDGKICAIIFPHPTTNGQMGNIAEDCKITDQTNSIIEIHITQQNEL